MGDKRIMEDLMYGLMATGFLGIYLYWSVYSYIKMKTWLICFLNFIFSILIGTASFAVSIPLSPYIQIFIIFVNLIILLEITLKKFNKKR